MDEVYKFLKENPVFYVATMDGDQPRVRPFGVVALFEDRLYLQTGNIKNVYKQMIKNPKIELCTMSKDGTSWLRVAAEVVHDGRIEARRRMLEENPVLKKLYAEDDGVGEVLWLKNAEATFYSFTEAPRTVKF
ncbi:pyridoxamine 5'-phosphate oxidase family protein [Cloacibacillus evryensis]|uniref:pyridoxamine 5'-phosphate oxidase family protein n=1 Tax=Cloacibacillus evryensis TaxID=508460 RepID=UPI0026DEDF94|nr:pyridoxamine 5'-phosphate oxidase family protein [Cloacibacillus evryensis]